MNQVFQKAKQFDFCCLVLGSNSSRAQLRFTQLIRGENKAAFLLT